MAGTFRVAVVTPEREVAALMAKFVALPAFDGEMGILAKRAPLLTQLGSGLLRIEGADGAKVSFFVSGGFAQMVEDKLTVLTPEALEPSAVSAEAARIAPARSAVPRTDATVAQGHNGEAAARGLPVPFSGPWTSGLGSPREPRALGLRPAVRRGGESGGRRRGRAGEVRL